MWWAFPGFSSLLESESQPGLVVQRGRLPPPVTLAQGGSAVEPGPCTTPRTMTNTDRQARQGRRSGEPFASLPLESPETPGRGLNGLDWKPPTNIPHDAANPDVSHEPPVPADGKIHTWGDQATPGLSLGIGIVQYLHHPGGLHGRGSTERSCSLSCFLKQASGGNTPRQQRTYGSIGGPRDQGADRVPQALAVNYLVAIRGTACQQTRDRYSNVRLYCRQGEYSSRLKLNTWLKTSSANGIAIAKHSCILHKR